MKIGLIYLSLILVILLVSYVSQHDYQMTTMNQTCSPKLVRLQLGDRYQSYFDNSDNSDIQITFQTLGQCKHLKVEVGNNGSISSYHNHEILKVEFEKKQFCHKSSCVNVTYHQFSHFFKLSIPNLGSFQYKIHDERFLGEYVEFKATVPQREITSRNQSFIFFGDMDISENSKETWNMLNTLNLTEIDAFIFLGDYAYDFYHDNGRRGDEFLQSLDQHGLTSSKAWIWMPGNHEENHNYTFFNDKFHLPNYHYSNNHYYSLNIGKAHFISLDLNFYYDGNHSQDEAARQKMLKWLERDLIEAENQRQKIPWIIVTSHIPLYCASEECDQNYQTYGPFESLFHKYGVDIFLGAHIHNYEVFKPMYNGNVQNFENVSSGLIRNPEATIYIIQGNAGNKYPSDPIQENKKEYLIHYETVYGIGKLIIMDESNVSIQHLEAKTKSISYELIINKDKHVGYQ